MVNVKIFIPFGAKKSLLSHLSSKDIARRSISPLDPETDGYLLIRERSLDAPATSPIGSALLAPRRTEMRGSGGRKDREKHRERDRQTERDRERYIFLFLSLYLSLSSLSLLCLEALKHAQHQARGHRPDHSREEGQPRFLPVNDHPG